MSIDSYFPPLPPYIKFRDNLRLNTNKLDGFNAIKSTVLGRKKEKKNVFLSSQRKDQSYTVKDPIMAQMYASRD